MIQAESNVVNGSIQPSIKQEEFTKVQRTIIERELKINDLGKKIKQNKRELKKMIKEYQALIALRDKCPLEYNGDDSE